MPRFHKCTSKNEFRQYSSEFTREASSRAKAADITGERYLSIVNSFNERSLGVLYDAHHDLLDAKITSVWASPSVRANKRAALRKELVYNGRNKPTVNKVLLADSYVEAFIPIEQRLKSPSPKRLLPNKNGMEATAGSERTITAANTPSCRERHGLPRPRRIFKPLEHNNGATDCGKYHSVNELSSEQRTPNNIVVDKETVSEKNRRKLLVGRTPPPPSRPPKTIFRRIENDKNVVESDENMSANDSKKNGHSNDDELAVAKSRLARAESRLAQVEKDLENARQDLKIQADALTHTLRLLGNATAKIAEAKSKSSKHSFP